MKKRKLHLLFKILFRLVIKILLGTRRKEQQSRKTLEYPGRTQCTQYEYRTLDEHRCAQNTHKILWTNTVQISDNRRVPLVVQNRVHSGAHESSPCFMGFLGSWCPIIEHCVDTCCISIIVWLDIAWSLNYVF